MQGSRAKLKSSTSCAICSSVSSESARASFLSHSFPTEHACQLNYWMDWLLAFANAESLFLTELTLHAAASHQDPTWHNDGNLEIVELLRHLVALGNRHERGSIAHVVM